MAPFSCLSGGPASPRVGGSLAFRSCLTLTSCRRLLPADPKQSSRGSRVTPAGDSCAETEGARRTCSWTRPRPAQTAPPQWPWRVPVRPPLLLGHVAAGPAQVPATCNAGAARVPAPRGPLPRRVRGPCALEDGSDIRGTHAALRWGALPGVAPGPLCMTASPPQRRSREASCMDRNQRALSPFPHAPVTSQTPRRRSQTAQQTAHVAGCANSSHTRAGCRVQRSD